jgi:hypothetical protein
MSARISESLTFEISLGAPIALRSVESHRDTLSRRGVYFLHDGVPNTTFDPYSPGVIYIGKAIGETIFSRCCKHRAALRGDPNMRPGKNFRTYCSDVPGAIENLYVVPGFMDAESPYLISCAEELLLYRYAQRHGKAPRANTK